MKKLIVNADDFGYTPGVSAGIIEAYRNGIITSTTALSVSPYFMEAIELAKALAPELAIGIHLTLTLANSKPLLSAEEVSSLVDENGLFLKQSKIKQQADSEEVEKEWEAQIQKFLSSGIKPDHIDSHHNIHGANEELLSIAIKLADKYNLPLRNCERKAEQLGMIKKIYGTVKTPDKMMSSFYGEDATMETFEKIVNSIINNEEEIYEMNCHPGFIDSQLEEKSSYVNYRVKELKLLTSKEIKEILQKKKIQLVNYGIFNK